MDDMASGGGAETTALILAGGKSRRMGRPKLLLPAPPHGAPLVVHVTQRLLAAAGEALVITGDEEARGRRGSGISPRPGPPGGGGSPAPGGSPACRTMKRGRGPLGGLATGLRRVEGWALVVAADMPLVSPAACRLIAAMADPAFDAVVPVAAGRRQTLHALYHIRCLPAVEKALGNRLLRMDGFWPDVRVREFSADRLRHVDPGLQTFVNVNTPQDWASAMALLSRGGARDGKMGAESRDCRPGHCN